MYIVNGKILHASLFTKKFVCNLSKCKGACCWEGDFGAPVKKHEMRDMEAALPGILELLSEESRQIIEKQGVAPFHRIQNKHLTPLHKNGACVYLHHTKDGIAKCAFDTAYRKGLTRFKKPISCHLYPIRVTSNRQTGFEALNYDEWEICTAACSLGEELKVPVFRFLKEAIVREYGSDFYDQMEDIYSSFFAED